MIWMKLLFECIFSSFRILRKLLNTKLKIQKGDKSTIFIMITTKKNFEPNKISNIMNT